MTRRIRLLALACVLLLAPGSARPGPFTLIIGNNLTAPPTNPSPFAHWDLRAFPGCVVPYSIGPLTADVPNGADVILGVNNAFAQWQNVSPAIISFSNRGNVAASAAVDNQNVVSWDNDLCSGDAWDAGLRGGAIGLTYVRHNVVTGRFSEVDVVLDDAHFTWTVGTQAAPQVTSGDDWTAVQTLPGGNRRVVIGAGANHICETTAVCGDVQLVALGVNAGGDLPVIVPAAAASVPPAAPTPLAGSAPNLAGEMDVWTICAHECGHFCGLGENNGPATGSDVSEGFTDGPYNIPGGTTLTFTINGNPVNAALTAGNPRTGAQIAADINAAIGAQQPGAGNAAATPTGGVVIQATAAGQAVIVTGGAGVGILGMLTGESGMATMNQPDPRGLNSTDQRTLSRHDTDGLNFLYTPDWGDAPDPGNSKYQTLVHGTVNANMLNGVQLFTPLPGAGSWFGYPPYRFEWLGANENASAAECEAQVTDQDQYDDGVYTPNGLVIGQTSRIQISVSTFAPPGAPARYANGVGAQMLYYNGYLDFNRNHLFDAPDRLLWWSGVPGATNASSASFNAGASNLAANPMTLAFDVPVPGDTDTTWVWFRSRLDYGEDEGRANDINGDLAAGQGLTQYGEIEDMPLPLAKATPVVACAPDANLDGGQNINLTFSGQNTGNADGNYTYALTETANWISVNNSGIPLQGNISLVIGESFELNVVVQPPANCENEDVDVLCLVLSLEGTDCADSCCTTITCTAPVPVRLAGFEAEPKRGEVELRWQLAGSSDLAGIHVYRGGNDGGWTRLTETPILPDRGESYSFTDHGVDPERDYRYQLGLVETGGAETRAGDVAVRTLPIPFALGSPYPNPTRLGFSIPLAMPAEGRAEVRVFDVNGRLVHTVFDGTLPAGDHVMAWDGKLADGRQAGTGIYFVVYRTAGKEASRRVVVL